MQETLTLPADKRVLREIAHLVRRFGSLAMFDAHTLHDVQVATAEAVTNAIVHGLGEDATREFMFQIEFVDKDVVITIRENGLPFDHTEAVRADLDSSLSDRKIGGLGLHLIHELMDSVEFSNEADGVKVLKMTKRLPGEQS